MTRVCVSALSDDAWTRSTSGCSCYWDASDQQCACCYDGGCQCPYSNRHQCVQCGYAGSCGIRKSRVVH